MSLTYAQMRPVLQEATIWISPDAGGYGWFTNPSLTGVTIPSGRVDLLTVLVHEVGHVLGYGDEAGQDVMGEFLAPGVRRLPGGLGDLTTWGSGLGRKRAGYTGHHHPGK
jgi:hypothetical protein